jgi:hypothetical protein
MVGGMQITGRRPLGGEMFKNSLTIHNQRSFWRIAAERFFSERIFETIMYAHREQQARLQR